MFPELMRDEVFRIETARLWLRWPTHAEVAADCAWAVRRAEADAPPSLIASTAIEQNLQRWRRENEAGQALNLLITPKAGARQPVGFVRIGPEAALEFGLDPLWQGRAFMTEAVEALVDIVFRVTTLPEIAAFARGTDDCGRGVLERLGFAFNGMEAAEAAAPAVDRFILDRTLRQREWSRLASLAAAGSRGLRMICSEA